MRVPKILFIDDERDLCEIFEIASKKFEVEVTTCESVAQAKLHLESETFDILITDIHLPDGDMTTVLDSIPSNIQVICVSGDHNPKEFLVNVSRPVRIMKKPIDINSLLSELVQQYSN